MATNSLQAIPYPTAARPGRLLHHVSSANPQSQQNLLFNTNNASPPFSSIVQVPVRQTLEANQKEESAEAKRKKELFTLLGPVLLLAGGLSWMLKGVPAGVHAKLFGRFIKSAEPKQVIDKALDKFGAATIGAGSAFLGANGILAGITSGQPSMIIGNILQFIPSAVLLFLPMLGNKKAAVGKVAEEAVKKKADLLRNIANSAIMATGGMFTVGFANEIRNKDSKTRDEQKRHYDMTRFQAFLDRKTDIPFQSRINGVLSELGKMVGFTLKDHGRLLKAIPADIRNIVGIFRNHPSEHPADTSLKDWFTKASADKSEIAALFFYIGALPVLLFSHKIPHLTNTRLFKTAAGKLPASLTETKLFKWMSKPVTKIAEAKTVKTLKWIGLLAANLSLFSIALNRKEFKGKAPLLGVPMAVFGMASGKPIPQGMGYAGESINNLLMSDVAVNGLKTDSKKQAPDADAKQQPFHPPNKTRNQTNPFQSSDLTKRYQISYT